jgi:hypothetical protein
MKKLTGSDIITLLKSAQKDKLVLKEAQALNRDDFHLDDPLVGYFFAVHPEGFSDSKLHMEKTASVMHSMKSVILTHGIRKAHNLLQNKRNASNEAVKLENEVSENVDTNTGLNQLKASGLVAFLAKYANGSKNKEVLAACLDDIHDQNLDQASEKLHFVFSSMYPEKNIKLAFTTLKNQMGESYQLCAKGIYNYGQAIPMAISNCREYCIDARKNPDGTVGCNYLKWLNDNLITSEQAWHLFDKMPYGSDYETNNLEKGQRTKFPMSDQDSQDMRMKRDEKLTEENTLEPWELKLEERNKKQPSIKVDQKSVISDKAIEFLLKDSRDVFDEHELDTLEEQIREMMGE